MSAGESPTQPQDNILITNVEDRFTQVGFAHSSLQKPNFFIICDGADFSGPLTLHQCRYRLPELLNEYRHIDVVERHSQA